MALNLDNLTNIDQVIGYLEHEFQDFLDKGEIDKSIIVAPQITLLQIVKRELEKKADK